MDLKVLICLAAWLYSINNAFAVTSIPDITVETTHVLFGYFKVPRRSIEAEIHLRTSNDGDCGKDFRESVFEPKGSSQVSLMFQHTIVTPKVGETGLHQSLTMTIVRNPVSLILAYFTTKFVPLGVSENSTSVCMLDSIEVVNGTITAKRGNDYLAAQFDLSDDCRTGMGNPTLEADSGTFFNSWYPNYFDFSSCDDNARNQTSCNILYGHRSRLMGVESDFCFSNRFEGKRCGANLKVVSLSGIFREKSLIEDNIPSKSILGEYFEGHHHRGVVYPCPYGDE